jgi:hypothetical protein
MGQTSDPETLVIHQKLTPGNNPKIFKATKVYVNSPLEENMTDATSPCRSSTTKVSMMWTFEHITTQFKLYRHVLTL